MSAIQTLIEKHIEEAAALRARRLELNAELHALTERLSEIDIIVEALSNSSTRRAAAPVRAFGETPQPEQPTVVMPAIPAPKRRGRPPGSGRKAAAGVTTPPAPKGKPGRKPKHMLAALEAEAMLEATEAVDYGEGVAHSEESGGDEPRKGRRKATLSSDQPQASAAAATNDEYAQLVQLALEQARQRGRRTAQAQEVLDWLLESGVVDLENPPTRNTVYGALTRAYQDTERGESAIRIGRPQRGTFEFDID